MATYKGIQGYTVQSLASDPTASDVVGQLWYNSASNVWKISAEGTGTWSAGNNVPNAGIRSSAGCGTQTAGLYSTGISNAVVASVGPSLEYDGTSWTEVNNVNQARAFAGGAGSQTAGVIMGGLNGGPIAPPPANIGALTETYNGTSWTEVNPINTARYYVGATNHAPATACLVMAGSPTSPGALVEEYNGTTWTEITPINTGRYSPGGAGTTTSALCFGGGATLAVTESWNGTAWSEVADLNTGRHNAGAAGESNTSALFYAGSPSYSNKTEKWDGTSWTELAVLANGRFALSPIGTASSALGGGGYYTNPPIAGGVATEEWSDPVYTITTVTTS